ncbi:hypothetical protein [Oleiharenicola lentus]|uniref:hypothetical protein n=1 Tax=Oleiharenicola lentus TaxID=2508720 RepID=UPI003F66C66A
MKTSLVRLFVASLAAAIALAPEAFAQRQLGKKKGPTSKIYLAEAKGESQIQSDGQVFTAKQATAFDAPGTVIETKSDSNNAFVYSNGTGMFVDHDTRIEIDRFVQEPFKPERATPSDRPIEPSVSQSDVFVARGAVGLCTSEFVSGSSMNYGTPQAGINIRGGRMSIEATPEETIVDLLEGDITVRGGERDIGGQVLRAGERAVIRPSLTGAAPTVTIMQIPEEARKVVDERVAIACNARKTVTFDVIEKKSAFGPDGDNSTPVANSNSATGQTPDVAVDELPSDQEIVVRPTVPANLPTNVVVSADRLPGT